MIYGFLERDAGECQPFRRRKISDFLSISFGPEVTSMFRLMQPTPFLSKNYLYILYKPGASCQESF